MTRDEHSHFCAYWLELVVRECRIEVVLAAGGYWLSVPCCFETVTKSFFKVNTLRHLLREYMLGISPSFNISAISTSGLCLPRALALISVLQNSSSFD